MLRGGSGEYYGSFKLGSSGSSIRERGVGWSLTRKREVVSPPTSQIFCKLANLATRISKIGYFQPPPFYFGRKRFVNHSPLLQKVWTGYQDMFFRFPGGDKCLSNATMAEW